MFVLYEMKDLVRITPSMFHLKLNHALEGELNRKLANKVTSKLLTVKRLFEQIF